MSVTEVKIKQYEEDISELKNLLAIATRENVKSSINAQLERWQNDLVRLKLEQDRINKLNSAASNAGSQSASLTGFTKQIDTFGWDQSEKFVKIYITDVKDLDKAKESDIVSNFTSRTCDVLIKNVNNINYKLTFANLLNEIQPSESYVKLKTEMVTVFLKKSKVGQNWSDVVLKKGAKSEKPDVMPKMDENEDPQAGLMSLMKKMYDDGDDEMKRTISKAFSESREKSLNGGGGDLGGLGI